MFERLTGRAPGFLGENARYAVIAPYLPETGELLFEVRAKTLGRQPGEVCFPGGRVEAGETPAQAALRETGEELLVDRAAISLIAPLDILFKEDEGAVIHPFLAELRGYRGSFQTGEVAEVFAVPLSFFLEREPEVHHNLVTAKPEEPEAFRRLLGKDYRPRTHRAPVYFYRCGEHLIWGMTARFVFNLVSLLREAPETLA